VQDRDWSESEWFKQWLELAKRDYHGKHGCEPFGYYVWPKPEPNNFNTLKNFKKDGK
jgi:hypothetical protein